MKPSEFSIRNTECVLSLDWDWFVGQEDGGSCLCCLECSAGRESANGQKVQTRLRASRRYRHVGGWQYREEFILRVAALVACFRVKRFVVANGHGYITRFLPSCAEVHNVDLHKDAWHNCGECGHWANNKHIKRYYWYKSEDSVEKKLPKRLARRRTLGLVFLALSTPHTARVDDKRFFRFVHALSGAAPPEFVGMLQGQLERGYRKEVVHAA